MKKTNYFLNRFFEKSINFKIPSQSSILFFDKRSKILEKTINKNNVSKLTIDRREINLFIFILTLFTGKISFINYAKTFIKVVNPKIVVTYIDNDINFYQLKYFFPSKYFISIQNGYRFKNRDFFDDLKEAKKKRIPLKADYYLCFNKFYAMYCKKFIKFSSILHGSYKNNLNKLTKVQKLEKNLLFISQYTPTINSFEEHSIFYSLEKKLLPILLEYCHKNKLKLIIMLRYSKENPKCDDEINFYNSSLKGKFKCVKKTNSYKFLDKYENILCIDSTLGYEALTRKKKVFFFHNRFKKFNNTFGWPKPLNNSNFSINKIEKKTIHKFLNKNLNLGFKKWFKINSKHFNDLIFYDYKNQQLLKLINDCLKRKLETKN